MIKQWILSKIFCRKGHDFVKPPGLPIVKCRFCGKIKYFLWGLICALVFIISCKKEFYIIPRENIYDTLGYSSITDTLAIRKTLDDIDSLQR